MKTATLSILSAILFALVSACGDDGSPDPNPEPTTEAGLPIPGTDSGVPSYSDGGSSSLPLCKIYTNKCSVVQSSYGDSFIYNLTCAVDPSYYSDNHFWALLMFFYPATGTYKVPCPKDYQCKTTIDPNGIINFQGGGKTNWKTTYTKMGIKVFNIKDEKCKANFVEMLIK